MTMSAVYGSEWLHHLAASEVPNDYEQYLISTSSPQSFSLGTGNDILSLAFGKIIREVKHELILVTCFWARSSSLRGLSDLLLLLSTKTVSRKSNIRVRICFSSLSFFQKLFHTTSEAGHVYKPTEWFSKLGLPPPESLPGLDLQVKSVFILPLSVMHPKFIIIDRETCLLSSCNVSWEDWLEGCIEVRGSIVKSVVQFWQSFWGRYADFCIPAPQDWPSIDDGTPASSHMLKQDAELPYGLNQNANTNAKARGDSLLSDNTPLPSTMNLPQDQIRTIFLPSQYHRNPVFRPFWFQQAPRPPATPLNTFILNLLDNAQQTIFMQTPNLTSPPVLSAILSALSRGVNIRIVTNEHLMWVEQLVTAGTTTPRCVQILVAEHMRMLDKYMAKSGTDPESSADTRPGVFCVGYYSPQPEDQYGRTADGGFPQQSHLKLTIVDREVVVLGSGNMDRASWYTSQELGVAFYSKQLAKAVRGAVEKALLWRVVKVYESEHIWGTR